MSDVSGIPNMGFGGGNFFAPQFSYNPQMSAGQASAAYMPAENYAQNVTNNLFSSGGGFGRQTNYYSGLGASYSAAGMSPYGVFSDTGAGGGGGGGASPYQTTPNVFDTGASGFAAPGAGAIDWSAFSPQASPYQSSPNVFNTGASSFQNPGAGLDWSNLFSGSGGGSKQDPYPNMSMPGGLNSPLSASSGASPLDWSNIFGGAKADPAPGMAMPGGLSSPMTTPQQSAESQQQPGINWGNVGAAAGAGSSMPYTSGIEPDMTGGRTLTGDAAPTATPQQQTTAPSAPDGTRTYDFKPMFEGGGGGGFGSGGTESQSFGGNAGSFGGNIFDYTTGGAPAAPNVAQDTASPNKSANAIAEEARARLAGIIGSPETEKAVEAANKAPAPPPSAPAGAPPLSDLSNLPPEFPDFTKHYPEYHGGYSFTTEGDAAASAGEPATDRLGNPLRPETDAPRPSADVFPAARLAPNGKEPELFVVHHTAGGGTPESVVEGWRTDPDPKRRGVVGAQYIMDRNGVVHDTANEYGYTAINQAKDLNVPGTGVSKAEGTSNRSIVGMEIIARNEKDVTPAQQAALVQFANERYPNTPFYGHSEISENRRPGNEGIPGANAILDARVAANPNMFPSPGFWDQLDAQKAGAQPLPAGASRPPAGIPDTPAEAVPLPTARPAAANIAQANSVLDSRILDLVQKNSPGDASRIPSSIANQTLREALGNSMTGGMIRSGLTPYLPQMGVTQAEFDKAYNSGLAVPPTQQDIKMRFFGNDENIANRPMGPESLTTDYNKNIYEGAYRSTMARDESLGTDPNPFTGFRQSENVDDRRFDPVLTDQQRMAIGPSGQWTPRPGEVPAAGGQLGEALGANTISALEARAQGLPSPPEGGWAAGPTNLTGIAGTNGVDVFEPSNSAFDLSPGGFGEGGYGNTFAQPVSRDDLASQIAEPGRVKMDFGGFSPSPEPRQGGVGPGVSLEPDFMDAIKEVESGGNPDKVKGSYKGLYQLDDKEFRKYGGQGSIFDPEENTKAASAKMIDETQQVQDRLGRALTPPEQYMVHQQGVAGALAHLANPDELAWKNFQGASGWNDTRAKTAIWGNMTPEMQAQFGNDVNNVTSRDFLRLWEDRYYGILNR